MSEFLEYTKDAPKRVSNTKGAYTMRKVRKPTFKSTKKHGKSNGFSKSGSVRYCLRTKPIRFSISTIKKPPITTRPPEDTGKSDKTAN